MSENVQSSNEFEIELSEKSIDMKDIYSFLTVQYKEEPENCPMAVIVQDLPDGRNTIPLKDGTGKTKVILVRHDVLKSVMTSYLYAEIMNPTEGEPFDPECSFYYTTGQIYDLYSMALSICDLLKIRCPQLIFTSNMPVEGLRSFSLLDQNQMANIIFLKENAQLTTSMSVYAAELRRAWQKEKHPRLYCEDFRPLTENPTEKDIHDFQMQKSEIDAEAFALRWMQHAIPNAIIRPNKDDEEVLTAIEARAAKISLSI